MSRRRRRRRRRLDGWMDDSIYSRFDDEVSFFSRPRRPRRSESSSLQ